MVWAKKRSKWRVQHISAATNKQAYLGSFAAFADACAARAAAVDGKATKGTLEVREGQLCVSHCGNHAAAAPSSRRPSLRPTSSQYKKEFSKYADALALLLHGSLPPPAPRLTRGAGASACPAAASRTSRETEGEHNERAKCRRVIEEIKAHWVANGGCRVCHTCDTDVLSGDHEGRLGKDDPWQCLDASWWACNGGAEALREHYLGPNSTVKCKCLFCHSLEKSHNIHTGRRPRRTWRRGRRPSVQRGYVVDKQAHANKEKKRRGKCEHPQCCDPTPLCRAW